MGGVAAGIIEGLEGVVADMSLMSGFQAVWRECGLHAARVRGTDSTETTILGSLLTPLT